MKNTEITTVENIEVSEVPSKTQNAGVDFAKNVGMTLGTAFISGVGTVLATYLLTKAIQRREERKARKMAEKMEKEAKAKEEVTILEKTKNQ